MARGWDEFVGQTVVLDTAGPLVYLGTLEGVTDEGFRCRESTADRISIR